MIDTAAPASFTCAQCPFARLIEDNRYCCQVSQTASDKAGLYWTIGNGWEVASLKYDTELTGQWEGFDLEQQLECNGIDLEELPADLRAAS